MNILGIETSCDETAAAVVKNGREVISSCVATQFEHHGKYAGVVPELASRAHVTAINQVIAKAVHHAHKKLKIKSRASLIDLKGIDAIAVTIGPGLAGSLLVGKMTAETLGWINNKPVWPVNHIEGHLLSPLLVNKVLKPPFLGLVVSGGHTELIYLPTWGSFHLLGSTRDDAAGEAFDKVAKMLHLGYPGGPIIDKLAKSGEENKSPFPRPWLPGSWDFSFSGLKTAVLYKLRTKGHWSSKEKRNICAGFQAAVVDVLVGKTLAAAKVLGVKKVVVGGGVAANSLLRRNLLNNGKAHKIGVYMVPPQLCTDNAAMIAASAFFKRKMGLNKVLTSLKIQPQLRISTIRKPIQPFRMSLTNF